MSLRLRAVRAPAVIVAFALATGCGPVAMAEGPAPMPPPPARQGAADAPADQANPAPATPQTAPQQSPAPAPAPENKSGDTKTVAPPAPQNAKSANPQKPQAPQAQTLVVYTGDMQLLVDADAQASTMDRIVDVAESEGGHLAGRTNDSIKVKIPSARFRDGMQKIEKLGSVTSENVSAEDVTAEYHDLEVRLENLKATRKRLEEFLAKAGSITDMLTVEKELERVAKEMDTIVGRLRFLGEHTAFSVLTVHIAAKPKPAAPVVAKETTAPAPPPPPRAIDLPVSWFATLGVEKLLTLPSSKK